MKNRLLNITNLLISSSIWIAIIYFNYNYIINTDPFKIDTVDIEGNDYIKDSDIITSIEKLIENKNLLNIEINKIQESVSRNKFIKSVRIYKKIPSIIKIDISEIKPIALINDKNKNYFIDINENIIEADINSINHFINTPIISSCNNLDLGLSKEIILSIYNYDSNLYNQLNELIYQNNLITLLFNNQTKVKIDKTNYKKGLMKFFSFVNQISGNNNLKIYKYIDLSIDNQIIVNEKKIKI